MVQSGRVALNIKNAEVERLATEVVAITGESKTETIRVALAERRRRLAWRAGGADRTESARRFLEREVWPTVPADQRGRRLTVAEDDAILGFGTEGV